MGVAKEGETIKKSVCNLCLSRCGIEAYVCNGKISKIKPMKGHPHSRLCPKGARLIDWVYSPDRITHPMRRVNGKWRKVSWDEALEYVSDKLTVLKERYGAKSVVVFSGIAFAGLYDVRAVLGRWGQLYGTPNLTTGGSFCHQAHVIGHSLTVNYEGTELRSDFSEAKCIVNWGTNPDSSRPFSAVEIYAAIKRGAKLIVIDPRKTKTARRADIHAQIRPGTDCALALGMLNVIISEELYDKEFVSKCTIGFEELAKHVEKYTPEEVSKITWVPPEMIVEIARTYAMTKPATITHYVSLDHSINGVQASRAVAILIAITGNLNVKGGNRICPRLKTTSLNIEGIALPSIEESIGATYPIFHKFTRHPSATSVTNAIITGKPYPIKGLIVDGSNPALTWPNSNKVKQALSKLDLLVVIDLFMTETAKMAEVFLPACSNLESKFLVIYSTPAQIPFILRAEPVIEPIGESRPDWRIWTELGRKMFPKIYFPWEDADEIYEAYLKESGIKLEELIKHPEGIFYAQWKEKDYLDNGFKTPSGKVEIYSRLLERYAYEPLPTFHEAEELRHDVLEKYPLTAITGARVPVFTHSQLRNIPLLRKHIPEPMVEINIRTAEKLGIRNGEVVRIESPMGEMKMRAKLTGDIHSKVVCVPHGWGGEANANLLTDDRARDPISGYPNLRSVEVRVTKLGT